MRMLHSMLLATDFRPASEEAADVAVRLATTFGSRVTLLHVLEPVPEWPAALAGEREEAAAALQEMGQKLAAQKVLVVESSVPVGPPADTIVRKAEEIDAELIVIGAGERSRVDHFSPGPVAQAVLEHALAPVLAVRAGEPALRFQKILCPVDQSGPSDRGMQNAVRLARVFGGEVVVLTVIPEVSWVSATVKTGHLGARAEYEAKWKVEFEKHLARVGFDDVKVTREIRHGVPHQEILAAAREHQADAIVMGATGKSRLARVLLGSVTRRVLRQLPCSLLLVKGEDVVEELYEEDFRIINLLMAQARDLLAAHAYETALAKYRRILARNPFHVEATAGLAETLEKLGRHDQARYYRERVEDLKAQGQA
jgi:universal stress protein E